MTGLGSLSAGLLLAGMSPVGLPSAGLSWPAVGCWLALYFSVGLAGTWLARRYAIGRQMIDQPGERRSHATPTPRGGGIAIVVAMLLALAWIAWIDTTRTQLYAAIATGLVLVAGIGWLDDHKPLPALLRLATHVVAAAILAWGVRGAGGDGIAVSCGFLLALVLVNIWNFMDGIDGLAASQAALVALGFVLLAGAQAGMGTALWLALALMAACMGFLPLNFPKARIFLGDVGSGALGFVLAALLALLLIPSSSHLPVLLLPLSAFVIDATLTLGSRMVRRERWWQPHTCHAYQRWARSKGRHDVATWSYAGWTAIAIAVAIAVKGSAPTVIMAVLGVTYLAGAIVWWRLQRKADMLESGVGR